MGVKNFYLLGGINKKKNPQAPNFLFVSSLQTRQKKLNMEKNLLQHLFQTIKLCFLALFLWTFNWPPIGQNLPTPPAFQPKLKLKKTSKNKGGLK